MVLAKTPHTRRAQAITWKVWVLGMLQKRSFEQCTLRYEDVREMMEEARPMILEKAQATGKS